MNVLKPADRSAAYKLLVICSLVISVVALYSSLRPRPSIPNNQVSESKPHGLLDRLESKNQLDVGYGVYPPYTMEDPNTHDVTGFSVDVIEYVAAQLNAKVVWHRLNWNTMSADLKRGDYDVIADPIFQTIPRAREFSFTEPYAFFADGIAVVSINEKRFSNFRDLDDTAVKVAVGKGWASETLVASRLKKAKIIQVQTSTDLLQVFNEVISGRADAAIADAADAQRFVNEHPTEVKALWLDNPPAFLPAGFALRPDDKDGAEFLTVALRSMKTLGILDSLAAKYNLSLTGRPQ